MKLPAERWRSGKRVLIACEDEKQADLDEALWARPAKSFVPHNLAGKTPPRGGARWRSPGRKDAAAARAIYSISLRTSFADFATAFTEVLAFFVPYEDSLKQLARENAYESTRVAGFDLNTATWK
ncbi:DNA polymerase III subunit chi [Escherichia coli]